MKFYHAYICAACVALLFSAVLFMGTGCENPVDKPRKPHILTEIAEYLESQPDNGPDEPIPLSFNLSAPNDWDVLLATLSYKWKYVALDISKSTWPELTLFDPGKHKTGKGFIANLKLPDISTGIVDGAEASPVFAHFVNLRSISGSNITVLGRYALEGVTSLQTARFPALTHIKDAAFANCRQLTDITIPESVSSIGDDAFANCSRLTGINIPENVTSIGDRTFIYCSSLTEIVIPANVSSIGNEAFTYCSKLAAIVIPGSVLSIGDNVFLDCRNLSRVHIEKGPTNIGTATFSSCIALESVNIPDGIESIGDYLFENCIALTSIELPESVTSIGISAFRSSGITGITIPANVESIGDSAFFGCRNLTSITIPNKVNVIQAETFRNSRLASIDIPESVTSIGDFAFTNSWLSSITIPENIKSIGNSAFEGCAWLTKVVFPAAITINTIGIATFRNSGLTSINIPPGVTSIGDYAFYGCRNLGDIVIPENVETINREAFAFCLGLSRVTFSGDIKESNFSPLNPFPGDLYDQYFSEGGGKGEYRTEKPGMNAKWSKW